MRLIPHVRLLPYNLRIIPLSLFNKGKNVEKSLYFRIYFYSHKSLISKQQIIILTLVNLIYFSDLFKNKIISLAMARKKASKPSSLLKRRSRSLDQKDDSVKLDPSILDEPSRPLLRQRFQLRGQIANNKNKVGYSLKLLLLGFDS